MNTSVFWTTISNCSSNSGGLPIETGLAVILTMLICFFINWIINKIGEND